MRILTYTTLFPNREMPRHGIFVAERLRHLLATGEANSTILAPVPWFPWRGQRFGSYGSFARVPGQETFEGCSVLHPRYPVIPKFGMTMAPLLLAAASYRAIRQSIGSLNDFDLVDAHYFYPDGVAAALLGRWFNKPVTITARGTDINLIAEYPLPRRQIRWAIREASGLVTVSDALRIRLLSLGAPREKVALLRNGVDLEKFQPLNKLAAREELGINGRTILSVGNLVELKGHDLAIDALEELSDVNLIIAGSGPLENELKDRASNREVADRVRFVGELDQSDLVRFYNAADCLVLCSSREGMANVLLESLACGTPIVATPVGGTPEVMLDAAAGVLMKDRSVTELVNSVNALFAAYPTRQSIRDYAERFSWRSTTEGQLRLFAQAIS